MIEKHYTCFHGKLESIHSNQCNARCFLKLRQDGRSISLTAMAPDWPIMPGNEISAAAKTRNPSHALALIDHTAKCRAILPPQRKRLRPDAEDFAIVLLMFALHLVTLSKFGYAVFIVAVLIYALITHFIPEAIRQRIAPRLACLIDDDYANWLETREDANTQQ